MTLVAAFYRFFDLPDPEGLRAELLPLAEGHGVKGSILLAAEGVNGTIAGTREGVEAVRSRLLAEPRCDGLAWRESAAEGAPFGRLKVRLKREIVTLGVPVDPVRGAGVRVAPGDWNALISDPGTVVIDTRNAYEVAIGSFEGAVDPATESFGDFPAWWAANRERLEGKRIAMFCTGGIRCEKSTAMLRSEGVEEVYHLDGGILGYLEAVGAEESLWRGECFVFDERVSVTHGLEEGEAVLCRACRKPLEPADTGRPEYEAGVSCHRCLGQFTDADRARFRERQRQMEAAARQGRRHMGPGG